MQVASSYYTVDSSVWLVLNNVWVVRHVNMQEMQAIILSRHLGRATKQNALGVYTPHGLDVCFYIWMAETSHQKKQTSLCFCCMERFQSVNCSCSVSGLLCSMCNHNALVASFLLRAGPRSQISNNTTLGYAFLQNTVTCYQCAKYCKTYYQSSRSLFTVTHSVKLKFVGKMQEISRTAKDSETAVENVLYVFIRNQAVILWVHKCNNRLKV